MFCAVVAAMLMLLIPGATQANVSRSIRINLIPAGQVQFLFDFLNDLVLGSSQLDC
jgi:hypothetical protein